MQRYWLIISLILLTTSVGCSDVPSETTVTSKTTAAFNPLCDRIPVSPRLPPGDVQTLAQTASPEAYAFALEQGAELIPVDDGKSFVVWWQPEGFNTSEDTVLVNLHGHAEWAVKGFEVWYPELTERHLAHLGVQWWFGRSLETNGYYEPQQIYKIINQVLTAKGIPPGHVIFEGFSMGSARAYGVTLYDHQCGSNWFGVSIANAGPWEDDYPLYSQILAGDFGATPFANTHWILFCGDQDENDYSQYETHVCTGMEHTQDRLTALGGNVDLFLVDPTGDHGSFMLNPDNRKQALDLAETLVDED